MKAGLIAIDKDLCKHTTNTLTEAVQHWLDTVLPVHVQSLTAQFINFKSGTSDRSWLVDIAFRGVADANQLP